jgi:hypothetical protein
MGLPGTVLFGVMLLHGFGRRRRLAASCRSALKTAGLSEPDRARAHWFLRFSSCMDASLVGFLSSGAFISVLYYPHVWLLTALTAAITGVGCRELAAMKARSADAAGPAGAGRAPVAWGRRGRLSPALTRA